MSEPSAEMRAAAQRLRTLASAATPGPWTVQPFVYGKPKDGWGEPSDFEIHAPGDSHMYVVSHMAHEGGGIGHRPDAELIAAMHPGIALAVADWLDSAANDAEAIGADPHAQAVARLVLEAK